MVVLQNYQSTKQLEMRLDIYHDEVGAGFFFDDMVQSYNVRVIGNYTMGIDLRAVAPGFFGTLYSIGPSELFWRVGVSARGNPEFARISWTQSNVDISEGAFGDFVEKEDTPIPNKADMEQRRGIL